MFSKTLSTLLVAAGLTLPALADAPDTQPLCEITEFSVYFAPGDAELTPQAEAALSAHAKHITRCTIADIEATAVTLTQADRDGSQDLSAARAETVLMALQAQGIDSPQHGIPVAFSTSFPDEDGFVPPLSRRIDVRITPLAALKS